MKKVWYISKYAVSLQQGGPSRQYLFAKSFAETGYNSILISSNSNGFTHMNINNDFIILEKKNKFKHVVLNGKKIALGFNFKRIISWITFEYRLIKYLKKQIKEDDIVIVSSLSILTFLSGIYLKKKYKIKLIVEVRDIWPLTLIEFKKLSKYNPFVMFLSWIEKKAYDNAEYIVGTMKNLNKHIKNVSPGNEHKFNYIPMGIENNQIKEISIDKTKKDVFIVGYAGSFGQANKVDLILDAAKLLSNKRDIYFYFLGDGVLLNKLKEKYAELDNVKFFPKVSKDKVFDFLLKCDILVNPWEDKSIYKYGVSPNKWIDYMHAAKPIIVPYNGYRNIINEANCGEFIETNNPGLLADTIIKYYKMPKEELIKIGLNGRKYLLNKLTIKKLTKRYIKLF